VHHGPFVRVPRPLPERLQAEAVALGARLGEPIVRAVVLDEVAFDPVGDPTRFAEVCMVVRRPSGRLLLSTKSFYPPGAHRLPTGGIDADEAIDARLAVAAQELAAKDEFPYQVVNDELDRAAEELEGIVRAELVQST